VLTPWRNLKRPTVGIDFVREADRAYQIANWPRSVGKDQEEVLTGAMWGATIDGLVGWAGVSREERALLACTTLRVLDKRPTRRMLSVLLGHWSAVLQMRRPGYSVLHSCFIEAKTEELDVAKALKPTSRIELFMLSCLSGLLETNLRADLVGGVGASDASSLR
jgi:hypothetical protein